MSRSIPYGWLIGGLGLATLVLRSDSFFHSLILPQDEAAYFRMVHQWLVDGTPLYGGSFDHKPPGIYYLYAIAMWLGGPSMVAVRWATVCHAWAGAVMAGLVARRLWAIYGIQRPSLMHGVHTPDASSSGWAAAWGAGLLYVAASCRMGGYSANTEIFFVPYLLACLWGVAVAGAEPSSPLPWRTLALAGVAGGIAFMIKYTVVLESAVWAGLWLAWRRGGSKLSGLVSGRAVTALGVYAAGYLAPVVLVCMHFLLGDRLDVLIYQSIMVNLRHASAPGHKWLAWAYYVGRMLAELAPLWPGVIWLIVQGLRGSKKDKTGVITLPCIVLLLGWGLVASGAAHITRHPFLHYIQEVVPILCLASGLLLAWLVEIITFGGISYLRPTVLAAWLVALPTIPALAAAAEEHLGNIPAQLSAWRRTGQIWSLDPTNQLAQYAKAHLAQGEYWFAVDGSPTLYLLSGHDLPTRYTFWSFMVSDHFARVTEMDQIAHLERLFALPPRLLALPTKDLQAYTKAHGYNPKFARFFERQRAKYVFVEEVAGWQVYRLL